MSAQAPNYRRAAILSFSLMAGQFITLSVRADQFVLDNGSVIAGTVVAEDQRWIVVKVPNGTIQLKRSQVLSITPDGASQESVAGMDAGQQTSSPASDESAAPGREVPGSAPKATGASLENPAPPAYAEKQMAADIEVVVSGYSTEGDQAALRLINAGKVSVQRTLDALETAPNPEAAARLITLLGHMKDASIASRLAALARRPDAAPEIRGAVACALADLGEGIAAEELTSLIDSPDPGLRQMAAAALGRLTDGSPEALTALCRHLGDRDEWTRTTAACSLLTLVEANPSEQVVGELVKRLDSGDTASRVNVALTLYQVQRPEGLRFLAALSQDVLAEDRVLAVEALKNCRVPESAEALLRCLKDEDPAVRRAAAGALRWSGRPDLIEQLKPLLRDPDESVRRAARASIARLRPS